MRILFYVSLKIKQFVKTNNLILEKLNARVHHLLNLNEELERKLCWTQDRLKELASGKEVLWLNSMLSFCKYEIRKRVTTCVEYIESLMNAWGLPSLTFKRVLL